MCFEPKEWEIYEAELKARLDDLEALRTATEKGREEGLAEGEAIGMAKSLQRMIDSGMTEAEARHILGL